MKFEEVKISTKTKKALKELGFEEMMPIQEKSIVTILEGKDIVGQAQTGTGKTAAFVIPILEQLEDNTGTIAMVLAPTRELALQIVGEFKKIGKYHDFKVAPLVGGMDMKRQLQSLKKDPEILVATPGRALDILKRGKISLDTIKTFVIDEVDEMFKSGFKEEIDKIIKFFPKEKQTLLFSATLKANVQKVADETCRNPEYISVSTGMEATKNIVQHAIILNEEEKLQILLDLLKINKQKRAIIFGRTKRRVKELTDALKNVGINAEGLQGDMKQGERNRVMLQFKKGKIKILVATDVAARGIDVDDIECVYNFDLPQEVEYYVHRIGRTGRAGKKGYAISFVKRRETSHIDRIKKEAKADIEYIKAPDQSKVLDIIKEKNLNKINSLVDKTNVKNNKEIIKKLKENYSEDEIISAFIDLINKNAKKSNDTLTKEPSVKINGKGRPRKKSNNRKGNYSRKGNYNRKSSNKKSKPRNNNYKNSSKKSKKSE